MKFRIMLIIVAFLTFILGGTSSSVTLSTNGCAEAEKIKIIQGVERAIFVSAEFSSIASRPWASLFEEPRLSHKIFAASVILFTSGDGEEAMSTHLDNIRLHPSSLTYECINFPDDPQQRTPSIFLKNSIGLTPWMPMFETSGGELSIDSKAWILLQLYITEKKRSYMEMAREDLRNSERKMQEAKGILKEAEDNFFAYL